MVDIRIGKAHPAVAGECVADFRIIIEDEHPMPLISDADWRVKLSRSYERDAAMLFDAFLRSLPAGTLDRLLGKMLAHRSSLFRLSYFSLAARDGHEADGVAVPDRQRDSDIPNG